MTLTMLFPSYRVKKYSDYEKKLESDEKEAASEKLMRRLYKKNFGGKNALIFLHNGSSIYKGTIKVFSSYRIDCDKKKVVKISSAQNFKGTFTENFPEDLKMSSLKLFIRMQLSL